MTQLLILTTFQNTDHNTHATHTHEILRDDLLTLLILTLFENRSLNFRAHSRTHLREWAQWVTQLLKLTGIWVKPYSYSLTSRDVNRHGEFRHKPWHGMAWRYRHAPPQGGKIFLRHAPPCHRIYKNPPQHFQTAMADFRHGIFRPPWRISATAFSGCGRDQYQNLFWYRYQNFGISIKLKCEIFA